MLESSMVDLGVAYLKNQRHFRIISQEVPFLSRCIDVVLIDEFENLISIEFKVNKWKHAIEQAKNHKLGADKSYICLPERRLTEALVSSLNEAQIGLMFFNPDKEQVVYEVISPINKTVKIGIFRNMLLDNIMRITDK